MVLACFGIWTGVLERKVKRPYSDQLNASLVTFPIWPVSTDAYEASQSTLWSRQAG